MYGNNYLKDFPQGGTIKSNKNCSFSKQGAFLDEVNWGVGSTVAAAASASTAWWFSDVAWALWGLLLLFFNWGSHWSAKFKGIVSKDEAQLRHAERAYHFHGVCHTIMDDRSSSYATQIKINTVRFRVSFAHLLARFLVSRAVFAAPQIVFFSANHQ